jgi:ribose transport system substrate-binding protein
MKKIIYMWVMPIIALLLTSCGGDGQNVNSQGESESKGTIGVSVLTLGNPFFNVIAEGVKEEAAKHGYDVVVVDGDRDVQKQANQIDDFLTKGVAAIILIHATDSPLDRPLKKQTVQEFQYLPVI